MVALRSTAVAAIRQPVTTAKTGLAVLWNRPWEVLAGNNPLDLNFDSTHTASPGSDEFERLLDRMNFPKAESGKLSWLVDGSDYFSELDQQITNARHSINIQVFIFDNDDIGVQYADMLKPRSSEVQVKVLFDDLGSTLAHNSAPETLGPDGFSPPKNISSYLRKDSEIQTRRTLNPWLACDHTKLLVFDHQIALIGGMNIGREYYSEWHDLMVRVEGPIVQSLSSEFNQAWLKAGPLGDFALLCKPVKFPLPSSVPGEIPLRRLRTDPAEGHYEILDATVLAIRGARKRIWIQTPYFSHDGIALAMKQAALRGVDVRLIIPFGDKATLMDVANISTSNALIKAGAKVYKYPKMTHLKAIICDDWGSVGSANLDTISMRINRELNLSFSDQATVQDLANTVFLPDFKKSTRVTLKETEGVLNSLAEVIADQL